MTEGADEKDLLVRMAMERLGFKEKEAVTVAEHMLDVKRDLMKGAKAEAVLKRIGKFVETFNSDFRVLERLRTVQRRSEDKKKKRRTQLDIFRGPGESR